MQPVLSLTAPVPGAVFLSGRFAGEVRPEEPLIFPVSAWGALLLGFAPLEPGWLPQTRRLTFSAGRLLAAGLARDVYAVEWPGGVTEVELAPARLDGAPPRQARAMDGVSYALVMGTEPALEIGALRVPLPAGAQLPELRRADGRLLFAGAAEGGGRYLAVVSGDGGRLLGLVSGSRIDVSGALIHAVVPHGDVVGHARLETWRLEADGLALAGAEPAWTDGAPRWPQTAEDTALAALQAAFLGLDAEAEGYLAPQLAASGRLRALTRDFNGCVPLKYAPPDARPAVGLLRAETPNCARVAPLRYRAAPMGGMQGPWRIEALAL